ncbi:MAG: antirestriction protein ArdA [Lewinellaceae bacterium]|nr:antirestriction protein ArdA [Saprospiraceae bacterium]MCB9338451.1 antirestriction protein ArdA [Lewinellaceae bacterium]
MLELYAQPYNINATGYYFDTADRFDEKAGNCFDAYGMKVEEFEIQFIDGDAINAELFRAWGVHQANVHQFLEAANGLDEHEKLALIAMARCGYTIDGHINTGDVVLHYCNDLKELAMQFIEDGLYGEFPESLSHYIDYDAIARDLGMEYKELSVGGQTVIYRCP